MILLLLIICSGLISGSEVAYFSLNRTDLANLQIEQSSSADRIMKLVKDPKRLLATILIANNFVNISIVIISDIILSNVISESHLASLSDTILSSLNLSNWIDYTSLARALNFLMAVVLSSFVLLIFGEVLPKIYARINRVQLAKWMAYPLLILSKAFYPMSSLLIRFSSIFEKKIEKRNLFQSMELKKDLDKAIEITASEGQESQEEVNFLKRILKFNDVMVRQIMKSRLDVIAIDTEVSFSEVLAIIRESGFSRLPVYAEDFDHVIGILYTKDLIPYLDEDNLSDWHTLIKPEVFYVPESKMIKDLLKQFQTRRTHMAIVVDEYGGNTGIVTLEDVMEEVTGEIKDEFDDEEEHEFFKIDENNYLFEGKTLINDFCKIMEIDPDVFEELRGESDSIAGLILETLASFPKKNQELKISNLKFTIISMNSRRIKQVKVSRINKKALSIE